MVRINVYIYSCLFFEKLPKLFEILLVLFVHLLLHVENRLHLLVREEVLHLLDLQEDPGC